MVAKKIAYNVIFGSVAKVLSTLLALIGIGYITRYLGKSGFGDYATVVAFFSFFGAIADLGLYSIATREISRKNSDQEKIIGNVFALRITSATLVLILSLMFVWFLPYSPDVKDGIIFAAVAFVFSSGYAVLNGVFQKHLAMYKVSVVELLGKVIQVGIMVWAVKNDLGFGVIIFAMVASAAASFFMVLWLSQKYLEVKMRFDFKYWEKFLKMALPMGISAVITFVYFKMDTILLSVLKSSEDVGIYNVAYKIIENVTFFPSMIVGLTLPLTSEYIFSDEKKFFKISNKTFKIFVILVVPIVIGGYMLADKMIYLIGGGGFVESIGVFKVLVFALLFIFFGNFFNNILIAGDLQKELMRALFFCALFNIIANLIFIPVYSYNAAAITSVATEALMVFLTSRLAFKRLKYKPHFDKIWRILASGVIMMMTLFLLAKANFFLLVITGGAVYFLSLFALKVVDEEEMESMIRSRI